MNKYVLKVYPKGLGRQVYRVMEVCGKDTLEDLCCEIMDSFDFIDEHLYEFCIDHGPYQEGNYHRQPEPGDKSAGISLDKLKLVKKQKFILHYDFGDDWIFVINVQNIQKADSYIKPVVTKSKGSVEQYPEWEDEE